ncbi:hypothetical protein Dda_6583 [Drechslerella dactyloides]|uniref:Uncharacterized protein n=1 Tax=Drechslerella dactyloides TaxID=74499 RepID=A0AAD6ITU4_DREDA|nr:hypothetical protein Dda_6583 [Drechslerella dactyloides]
MECPQSYLEASEQASGLGLLQQEGQQPAGIGKRTGFLCGQSSPKSHPGAAIFAREGMGPGAAEPGPRWCRDTLRSKANDLLDDTGEARTSLGSVQGSKMGPVSVAIQKPGDG